MSEELMAKMKENLCTEWEVTDLGEPAKIVDIEITRKERSITISQECYIDAILEKEGMQCTNPVAMPMDPNDLLEPNPDGNEGDRSNSYGCALSELQFLANATRPDISYAVNRLAAYTANPSLQHTGALKRILCYLKGTKSYGITYSGTPHKNRNMNLFHGYTNAAYANSDGHKSTTGYVYLVGGGVITWMSKKQSVVAMSLTDAEYVALSEAGRKACWLRSLYQELGYTQEQPTQIRCDNNGAIAMTQNLQFHKRAKHIDIRWHWIHDLVEEGTINVQSCQDPEQTADILTKVLACPKHKKHSEEMGMAPA
jgi:hypothetical protein